MRSRCTSAWSPDTTLGFIAAAASDASTPASDGGELTQPKNAGCPFPIAYGSTSRAIVPASGPSAGRPVRKRQREQLRAQVVRQRLPDRPLRQRREVVGDRVDQLVAGPAELLQVAGAELARMRGALTLPA